SMPRRRFGTRSVPPASRRACGSAASSAAASATLLGRLSSNAGMLSMSAPFRSRRCGRGLRGAQALLAPPGLDRFEYAIRRDRELVQADADRVVDRVGKGRREAVQRALAGLLGAERPERIVGFDQLDLDRRRIGDRRDPAVEHVRAPRQALAYRVTSVADSPPIEE